MFLEPAELEVLAGKDDNGSKEAAGGDLRFEL